LPSDEISQLQDFYFTLPEKSEERKALLNEHPELTNLWDIKRKQKNEQRQMLGLPPLDDTFGGSGSGGGGSKSSSSKKKSMVTQAEKERKAIQKALEKKQSELEKVMEKIEERKRQERIDSLIQQGKLSQKVIQGMGGNIDPKVLDVLLSQPKKISVRGLKEKIVPSGSYKNIKAPEKIKLNYPT
jgi:hypothetical protein